MSCSLERASSHHPLLTLGVSSPATEVPQHVRRPPTEVGHIMFLQPRDSYKM